MLIDKSLTRSRTLQFGMKVRELKQQGREVISLGMGEPDFETPEHIKQAAKDALDAGLTRYSHAMGLPELRELIADKLQNENGIAAKTEQIIVTPGAKNALFISCAAVLQPGDEVINFNPCYVSTYPILKLAEPQAIIHNVPMIPEKFTIDKNKIRSLINDKTKLIMINYPNNPLGTMIGDDEVNFLLEIIQEYDINLLSDEIYEKVTFGQTKHISLGALTDIQDKVITVNGFSKAYSMTGWRIGYVHANAELTSRMIIINDHLNMNTAAFIQKGAVAALTGPQDHLIDFIEALKKRKAAYDSLLQGNEYLTGSSPEGGFFGFINISQSGLNSDDFATQLLDETGVCLIPGVSFGQEFDHYCRVSLVNQTEVVEEGLKRIGNFITKRVEADG